MMPCGFNEVTVSITDPLLLRLSPDTHLRPAITGLATLSVIGDGGCHCDAFQASVTPFTYQVFVFLPGVEAMLFSAFYAGSLPRFLFDYADLRPLLRAIHLASDAFGVTLF